MIPDIPSFDRVFATGDPELFQQAVQKLVGQPCVAWRNSYMHSGHFHFGELVPVPNRRPLAVHHDQGLWIITLWDCERRLVLADGTAYDSRQGDIDRISAFLDAQVGDVLTSLDIDPADLMLRLSFQSGVTLELPPDTLLGAEAEQWAIEDATGRALVGYGERRWALEGAPDSSD